MSENDQGATLPDPFIGLVNMVDVGHKYTNAPIIEATIDLRVSLPSEVGLDSLSGLYPDLGEPGGFFQFVPVRDNNLFTAESTEQQGYRYVSKKQFVITASLDRFAYSQLSKYSTWEDFVTQVEPRWEKYKSVANPMLITNVGVRYVNRIVIPKVCVEINDYLRTTVDISPYLPQAIERYFAQISFPIAAFGVDATVTTTMVDPPVPDATALVLDVDVTHEVALDPTADSFTEDLTAEFDVLRNAKNYVFEACITDATRGVIDRGDNATESGA